MILLIKNYKISIFCYILLIVFISDFVPLTQAQQLFLPTVEQIALEQQNKMLPQKEGQISSSSSELWKAPLARKEQFPSQIVLEGNMAGKSFVPQQAYPQFQQKPLPSQTIPFFQTPMIPQVQFRSYGKEERVKISADVHGWALIHCRNGNYPAGVLVDVSGNLLEQGMRQGLFVQTATTGDFYAAFTPKGADMPPNRFNLARKETVFIQPPANATDTVAWQLTITCPLEESELSIKAISEHSLPSDISANQIRAAWVWDFKQWQDHSQNLFEQVKKYNLNQLYLQIEIEEGKIQKVEKLRSFIELAHYQGIRVFAVEGDAEMVLADGLKYALGRTQVLRNYQTASPVAQRLDGLQYDIEPYLLPEYAQDPQKVFKQWALAIEKLHQVWGEPLELAVPFWLLESEFARQALESVRPFAATLAVMAYRTDSASVIQASAPLLTWGLENQVSIVVALENGPIADQVQRVYTRSLQEGTLVYTHGTIYDYVTLFEKPQPAQTSAAFYQFSHQVDVPGSRISFQGDINKLLEVEQSIVPVFSGWSSFAGIALHGL